MPGSLRPRRRPPGIDPKGSHRRKRCVAVSGSVATSSRATGGPSGTGKERLATILLPNSVAHDDTDQDERQAKGRFWPTYQDRQVHPDTEQNGNHPIYKWAAAERPLELPRWNFHKYLIGRDGHIVASFATTVEPTDARVTAAIEKELGRST